MAGSIQYRADGVTEIQKPPGHADRAMGRGFYRKMFRNIAYNRYYRVSLMVLSFLIMACSEKNADAPDYNKVHTEAWYNTQYLNEALFHGTEVKTQGTDSCIKCHNIYGEGRENIPGCYKCHFGPDGSKVPRDSIWVHGLERHEEFSDDESVCNNCHEVGRSFGTGPGICHNCHGSGETHVLGQPWLDPKSAQFHGPVPQDECANCHDITQDCSQCHFGSTGSKAPIGSGWLHGNNEGHKEYESQNTTCSQCHTLNRSYNNGPNSCHDCHEIESHVFGQPWLDSTLPDYHGNQPQQDCDNCHNLSTNCYQCHFGPTGGKSPSGSSWPHGREDNHNDLKSYSAICNQCHSLTQEYRNEPDDPECHVCHND